MEVLVPEFNGTVKRTKMKTIELSADAIYL